MLLHLQRDAEYRSLFQSYLLVHFFEVALVGPRVRHDQALATCRHSASDPLSRRQSPAARDLAFVANGLLADQFVRLRVYKPDRGSDHT